MIKKHALQLLKRRNQNNICHNNYTFLFPNDFIIIYPSLNHCRNLLLKITKLK